MKIQITKIPEKYPKLILMFEKETGKNATFKNRKISGQFKQWLHQKLNNRPTKCDICNKEFKSRRSMRSHRRYHNKKFRENMCKLQREANNRPEVKEKRTKASKEVWSRPGYREKMSKLRKGENNSMYDVHRYGKENPNWKGDEAGYNAIHKRVAKRKIKPENCEICGLPEFHENLGRLELSDITGLCLDDVDNFQYIHHSCHVKYDVRNNIVHVKIWCY